MSGIVYDKTFLPIGAVAPESQPDAIRIGSFEPRSVVAGPGQRAVVWVTGCLRRCPGCMKPEWFDFSAGTLTSVADLESLILKHHLADRLDGVTFSGGEPFEQSEPLAALAKRLHSAGLDVLTYSGYQLAALRAELRFMPLLQQSDYLIDGEYRGTLPTFQWGGSLNQTVYRVHHNGETLDADPLEKVEAVREVQLSIEGERLRLTGFPDESLQAGLTAALGRRGLLVAKASWTSHE